MHVDTGFEPLVTERSVQVHSAPLAAIEQFA
jgi:hypothetical protein